MQQGFDINKLHQEAQIRWLKPSEVFFILQNHEKYNLTLQPQNKPPSGSLFLFNRRVLRFFRKDGHAWRKKKDGRAVGEAHERLKVGNVDALNCYYAHGEENPYFQRRSYWMLDPAYEHIVLVHYREVAEGRCITPSGSNLSADESSNFTNSTSASNVQIYSFSPEPNGIYEPCHSSCSPGSAEVVSSLERSGRIHFETVDGSVSHDPSSQPEVRRALRKLTEQLSLEDDNSLYGEEKLPSFSIQNEESQGLSLLDFIASEAQESSANLLDTYDYLEPPNHAEDAGKHDCYMGIHLPRVLGENGLPQSPLPGPGLSIERKDDPSWKDMLDLSSSSTKTYNNSVTSNLQVKEGFAKSSNPLRGMLPATPQEREVSLSCSAQQEISAVSYQETEKLTYIQLDHQGRRLDNRMKNDQIPGNDLQLQLSAARRFLWGSDSPLQSPISISHYPEIGKQIHHNSGNSDLETNSVMMLRKENSIDWTEATPLSVQNSTAYPDISEIWFDQHHFGNPLATASSLTLAQKQWFSIHEISPEWAFSSEATKVIIAGTFLSSPSECPWAVMFGDIEVPAEIVQEGVLRCKSPQHDIGKVTLCITSGNRESCSEIREFEFCAKTTASNLIGTSRQAGVNKNSEELSLLVRFSHMLLCGCDTSSAPRANGVDIEATGKSKLTHGLWCQFTDEFFAGAENLPVSMDWLIQELLEDKFQQWLLLKCRGNQSSDCALSKQEQGIIHIICGLGYEWALNPILNCGVGINFRDASGWTALHWAARFGREKMVAALLAAGASAGAVTDPTAQDPVGKTPAYIAAANGHKGLAGYLSEAALTSHLSTLTLEESEISKGSAEVEAERTMQSISQGTDQLPVGGTEDQLSLRDSLAACRNAAQAAARIQCAFRAHSFRKKQQKAAVCPDDCGMTPNDIRDLSVALKVYRPLHSSCDQRFDKAALSIQKNYKRWKGRKNFLTLRQHVVRIQAHFRGHQVRKKYHEILWSVGVVDKAILRWRRRGVGLRGFRAEPGMIDDEDGEDIANVFRKTKVDAAIKESVSRVLSMARSPEARQQYRRVLEGYRQAKAESSNADEATSTFQADLDLLLDDDGGMLMFT